MSILINYNFIKLKKMFNVILLKHLLNSCEIKQKKFPVTLWLENKVTVGRANGHTKSVTWFRSHCDLDAKNSKKV